MASFPKSAANIEALAQIVASGLSGHGDVYPDPPVVADALADLLAEYTAARNAAVTAQATAEAATPGAPGPRTPNSPP